MSDDNPIDKLRKLRAVIAEVAAEEFGLELEGFSVAPTEDEDEAFSQVIFIFRNLPRAWGEEDPSQVGYDDAFDALVAGERAAEVGAKAKVARQSLEEQLGDISRRTGLGFDDE